MANKFLIRVMDEQEGKEIISVGYRWSNYTVPALYNIKTIVNIINTSIVTSEDDLIINIVKMLEARGGGVYDKDFDFFKNKYPNIAFKKENIDGYYGLAIINSSETQDLIDVVDSYAEIYIKEKYISFSTFFDNVNGFFLKNEITDFEQVDFKLLDLYEIKFNNLNNIITNLEKIKGTNFKTKDNVSCELVY